ncbi:MAG: hypothetical protein NTX33_06140 [Propionibacteriales bacterium]|nr:hypothetical protein [Propionibacteriales bacterium]
MPKHRRRRQAPTPHSPRRFAGIALTTALLAALTASVLPAEAGTTIVTPTEAGSPPIVRGSSVDVVVDRAAVNYTRSNATSNFTAQSIAAVALSGCRGDNPAGTNNSPRTQVTVTDPNGDVVLTKLSEVRDLSFGGFLTSPANKPLAPQPAPGNTNYRGGIPNSGGGFSATVNLDGKPAGIYTVTTTETNMVKTGLGACTVGTPATTMTGFGSTFVTGPKVSTQTFEYRPWTVQFKDVFGKGSVRANIEPAEYQYAVDTATSPITQSAATPGGPTVKFYGFDGAFALPSDPAACVASPSTCLPDVAAPCVPSTGCTPRVMLINRPTTATSTDALVGVFDLDTKAFIAYASLNGKTRTLMSLGTVNDAYYHDLLNKLSTSAAAQGVDLASILATEVSVGNGQKKVSLSLLNGLQIDPSSSPGGVQITTDATVQAGVILDIYSSLRLTGGACVANSADSSTEPNRYTRNENNGYNVTKSDLLPEVPTVGPLGVLVGGPLYHITGKFNSDALVNTATAAIGVDTAAGNPNGLPVWISPFLGGIHTAKPKTMDFLGTGTWSASESPVLTGCLVVDFLLGTGVAVYNNPLPVGFGTIFDPLATPTPAAEQLTDAVNDAVDQVVGLASANPTVSALLTQVTALLPLS